ncbi:hypothetical protein ACUXAV_003646 [Cupriavidus metallidurans]|jgi:hypothetical protein|nr:hypothetical protein AU374_00365 [Cupriavidus metallidurans]
MQECCDLILDGARSATAMLGFADAPVEAGNVVRLGAVA